MPMGLRPRDMGTRAAARFGVRSSAGLADLVDGRPAKRAGTLGRRLPILHGDRLGVLHLNLLLVFKAIPFHCNNLSVRHSRFALAQPNPPYCSRALPPIQPQFTAPTAGGRSEAASEGPRRTGPGPGKDRPKIGLRPSETPPTSRPRRA